MKAFITSLLFVLLTVSVSGQVVDIEDLAFERGEGVELPIENGYVVIGDKVKRTLRSDYYHTEGSIELQEGTWAILAIGLGGDDSTGYLTTDLELDFSPTRCVDSLGNDWNNAFTISCPLRFLNFEIKTGYELTLLLILPLEST